MLPAARLLDCSRSDGPRKHRLIAGVIGLASAWCGTARAQPTSKTFIDYIRPTPITCASLSSATWGVAGVLPRDLCNGIESAKGAGVPPDYYYWDGKIIRAKDGSYHLFGSSWPGSKGFNPGWLSSDAIHAVSSTAILGPYERQGYAYDNGPDSGDRHKGHNVSAVELLDGTYALIVSEVVPFSVFTSASLNGPWTPCPASNGDRIQTNGVNAGSDSHWDSNVSLVARADGKFEIVQRHGLIALSDTVCGPYKLEQPTNKYPANQQPPFASIYPNRQRHTSADPQAPGSVQSTYSLAEDPLIWYSGGKYHVLYDYPGDRVGYHLSSLDGVHDWTDEGLAYDPRLAQKLFSYVASTTVNQWNKMERPSVLLQDGHVTHVTWAVSDVDKDNQIPANSNHGSKIIVVPFDGVAFDAETGIGGTGGTGSAGASGSSAGGGMGPGGSGNAGSGGVGGASNPPNTGGTAGLASSGGASAQAGSSTAVAGSSNAGSGGAAVTAGTHGGGASASASSDTNGCSCNLARRQPRVLGLGGWGLLGLIAARRRQRRARRSRSQEQ